MLPRLTNALRGNSAIVIILVSIAIAHIGQGVISPVIPLFADEFGIGPTLVGMVVASFGLGRLLLNLPSGMAVGRVGRKPLMVFGLLSSGLFMGLTGVSHSIGELMIWRFLAGAGTAIFNIGAITYIIDSSTQANRGKLLGLQQGALLVGTDIGPILGGVVADLMGFRWAFYISAMVYAAGAYWVFQYLPGRATPATEEPGDASEKPSGKGRDSGFEFTVLSSVMKSPTFILVSVFSMVVFFTRSGSRQTILPLLGYEQIAISATSLGLLFTVMTTINTLGALPIGAFSDRFGRKALLVPGSFMTFLGLMIFVYADGLGMYYLGAVVMGIGAGIVGPTPNAYAGDLAPPGKIGVTMGIFRSFNDVGFILGPIVLGGIAQLSTLGTAMGFNAALLLGLAVLLWVVGKETAGRGRGKVEETHG